MSLVTTEKVACSECEVLILPTTSAKNNGLCMPCVKGTREYIDNIDPKENSDTKTRQYNNFDITVWKTNDKDWIKKRKTRWPSVKKTLDHLHKLSINGIDSLRFKSDYKYIKQFYLSGVIDYPKVKGEICIISSILRMKSPIDLVNVESALLLECWLTPEPSIEMWGKIVERYESGFDIESRKYGNRSPFEKSRIILLKAILEWYTTDNEYSLFDKLETQLIDFFEPFATIDNYWEELLWHLISPCGWSGGELLYNSNHPMYDFSKNIAEDLTPSFLGRVELINSQQKDSKRKHKYYSRKNIENFTNQFSTLYFISNHPENFGLKQVTMADDIMKEVEQLKLPLELIESLEQAQEKSIDEEKMINVIKKGSYELCC